MANGTGEGVTVEPVEEYALCIKTSNETTGAGRKGWQVGPRGTWEVGVQCVYYLTIRKSVAPPFDTRGSVAP